MSQNQKVDDSLKNPFREKIKAAVSEIIRYQEKENWTLIRILKQKVGIAELVQELLNCSVNIYDLHLEKSLVYSLICECTYL